MTIKVLQRILINDKPNPITGFTCNFIKVYYWQSFNGTGPWTTAWSLLGHCVVCRKLSEI